MWTVSPKLSSTVLNKQSDIFDLFSNQKSKAQTSWVVSFDLAPLQKKPKTLANKGSAYNAHE